MLLEASVNGDVKPCEEKWVVKPVKFERIRRITGILTR